MAYRHPYILACLALLLMVNVGGAEAQNRTTVTLDFDGSEDLRDRAEDHVSRFLTELNRASYFDTQPEFDRRDVTEAATSDVLSKWKTRRYRCPETRIDRELVRVGDGQTFEVRSIPLLLETRRGTEEQREGHLVLDDRARVDGFAFESDGPTESETGTIVIRSKPTDATVIAAIGGGTHRSSPARFEEVPANTYAFTLRKDGYRTVEDTIFTVRDNQVIEHTVTLTPTTGVLKLGDVPADATVLFDGKERSARGPMDVTAGEHTVQVSKKYFVPWDTTVSVSAGKTTTVTPHLRRKKISLDLESTPPGATVYVDGDSVGTTPLDASLDAGRTYNVRLTKAGSLPSSPIRVPAESDSAVEKRIALTAIEMRSSAEHARFANVEARRSNGLVDLRYDLIGESGETYRVDLTAHGPDGSAVSLAADTVRGDLGANLAPGPDKLIQWRSSLPPGSTVRLHLSSPGNNNRLLYVLGGAGAVTATVAAILLGGGSDGGNTSFPAPPGLPN